MSSDGIDKSAPTYDDDLDGSGLRIGVVAARFNEPITGQLLEGVHDGLTDHGVDDDDIEIAWVPGAFELPLAAQWMADSGEFDAVICLGAVIRGDTPHFDFVAAHAASGIGRVALDTGVPVIFGVLTTDTVEQAVQRAALDRDNKGYEAAQGAIHMALLLRGLPGGSPGDGTEVDIRVGADQHGAGSDDDEEVE